MNTSLQNRVYVVTGGSRGFGLEIGKCLVAQGAKVGLLSRNPASLTLAVEEIGGDHAFGVAVDVGRKEALCVAIRSVREHFGRLDGLVNNAGLARPDKIENLKEDEVLLQVNTNFLGTVFACQAAVPLLRGGDNPRIINISSASAYHFDEMSHLSIYAATKAAVERFTRDLAAELGADGIGVTCIRPGAAGTSFAQGWNEESLIQGLEAWLDAGAYTRVGMETSHVAEVVAFALSQPPGVAVDLLEVRPNRPMKKG